jgi:hypothetical protein
LFVSCLSIFVMPMNLLQKLKERLCLSNNDLLGKFKVYNLFTLNLCFAHCLFYGWHGIYEALLISIIFMISLIFFYFKIQSYLNHYFFLLFVGSQCVIGLSFFYHESNGIYLLMLPIYLGFHLLLNTASFRKILCFN